MTAKDKVFKAKIRLIMTAPFYATLALKMHYIETKDDPEVKTACTDGKSIWYNPDFIDTLDLDETVFLLAHEVMHPAMFHHLRMQGREPRKWNMAADYPINELLTKAGMKMPKGGLLNPAYDGMSAEKIYTMLPDLPPDPGGHPDPGSCGGVRQPKIKSQAELSQLEAENKQAIAQALHEAKRQGKLPAGLERLVSNLLEPRVNWKEALQQFLVQSERNDYSFRKPNPRYLNSGFYLPYLYSEAIGEIVLIADTSGSTSREINQFASEMQEIVNTFDKGFKVLYVDSELAGIETVDPDEPVELHPVGGGGTSFAPGFDYLQQQGDNYSCAVYLTDGYCNDYPEQEPDMPVLWVLTQKNDYFKPPFGDSIYMDL